MTTISLSDKFLKAHSNNSFIFGVLRNTKVIESNNNTKAILDNVYDDIRKKYRNIDFDLDKNSIAYRKISQKIGHKRFGFPDGQINRVLKGENISNINNVVNSYMVFELLNNLSFSAYDIDKIEGEVLIDLSRGNETVELIGGKRVVTPINDVVFRDKQGVFYSFTCGYVDRTKIINNTKNILLVVDTPEGVDVNSSTFIMEKLCNSFGANEIYVLKSNKPKLQIRKDKNV